MLGLFALLTGLYAWIFKRRSWAGIPSRKMGAIAATAGLVITFAGGAMADPAPTSPANLVSTATETPAMDIPSVTARASATATETSPALTTCTSKAATKKYGDQIFVCTLARNSKLVWLEKKTSEKLVAELVAEKAAAEKLATQKAVAKIAQTQKVAAEKVAADQAAAEKVAAEKVAADQAAAEKVAAQKAAAEQAAAEQAAAEQAAAQKAAAEQAAVPPAPVQEAPAVQPPVFVHPGAYCSGGTGVSKTGKPMVCAPASDGRLRWQSP